MMLNDFEVFSWVNLENSDLHNPTSVFFLMDGVSSVIVKKNGIYKLHSIFRQFGDAVDTADGIGNGAFGIVIRRDGLYLHRDHNKYTNLQDALTGLSL